MRTLLLLLAALAHPAFAVERVVDFHSTIRVRADGVLTVNERIVVQAEGREIRRGILRDFPTDYRDRFGNRVNVPFEVLDVQRNGARENYALERLPNGVRIRIGRGDVLLRPGEHTYDITYRTARQIGYFADHDELYWNVNGSGWTFAFDHISAEVRLPQPVPAAELRAEAYTGPQGARGRDYQQLIRDGAVGFSSTRPFVPYSGMTIVVGFPKGIVGAPSLRTRAGWFLSQNLGVAAGLAGLALTLAFLWWRWLLVGRDPREGPKFPRYEAPKGVGPAAVRFIHKQRYDERCFAAALLGLGSRGFLGIKQLPKGYRLTPTGNKVEMLPGDSALAQLASSARTIGTEYDPEVQAARAAHERELALLHEERTFSRNIGSFVGGAILAGAAVAAMFLLDAPLGATGFIGVLLSVILILFKRWLPAYSVAGRRLEDEIEGLRQYLGVAEKDDLKRITPEVFSRFLPYAVALDVEKTWADKFARALGVAAVAQAVSSWYSSNEYGSSSASRFTDSLSSMGPSISASSTPPGSSSGFSSDSGGGGGGGSSGGGGGGGGGSGW
jgi:uncharacterized membrane protein YgcG